MDENWKIRTFKRRNSYEPDERRKDISRISQKDHHDSD